ncbi:hypothetical protein WH47_05027 [Habropoda laboriosa]|uniref:Uncharacterized protein n=1 Tax=Habropoda laboriosa TaxID=597456 RepID=A0A0L7RJX7_9HYME|nr:hypothetical protein WH47_05027 [Habropoda laboriosa]
MITTMMMMMMMMPLLYSLVSKDSRRHFGKTPYFIRYTSKRYNRLCLQLTT